MAAPVIAYVTSLGYLYCCACAERLEIGGTPVHADDAAHAGERCDGCHAEVQA